MRLFTALARWPVFLSLLLCAGWTQGQTYLYVSPNGSASGLTPQSPTDLQTALDYARTDGAANIIYLTKGIYDASTATFLLDSTQHDNQDITILGGYATDFGSQQIDPTLTRLDGGGLKQIMKVEGQNGLDYSLTIENLIFANGYEGSFGGGALAIISGTPGNYGAIAGHFTNVHFVNNVAGNTSNKRSGGAIIASTPLYIDRCYFYGNVASSGGAAYLSSFPDGSLPDYVITHSVFDSNSIYHWQGHVLFVRGNVELAHSELIGTGSTYISPGSAVEIYTNAFAYIHHNRFFDMTTLHWGTAIDLWDADGVIVNNTFEKMRMSFSGSGYGTISYFHNNNSAARKLYITHNTFYDVGYALISNSNAVVYRGNAQDSVWIYNNIAYNPPGGMGDTYMFYNMDYWAGGTMILGHNLSSGTLPLTAAGTIDAGGNLPGTDPFFEGSSAVILSSSSPAIDAGSPAAPYLTDTDIRGAVRQLGTYPDIGAYEYSNAPTSVQLNGNTVDENVPIGTLVGKFTTTDPDIGDRFTYHFTGVGDHDFFAIVSDSLVTAKAINYEGIFELEFFILSEDSGGDTVSGRITVEIIDVNEPGFVANPIPDQVATVNELWQFTVPANTFEDPDLADHFVPESYLSDGNPLPAWLYFDPDAVAFSGTTAQIGTWNIVVKMTDNGNHIITDTFNLTVSGSSGLSLIDTPVVRVYPNPALDKFCIDLETNLPVRYRVLSVTGQAVVFSAAPISSGQHWVSCQGWPSGLYLLQFTQDNHIQQQAIIIR